MHTTTFTLNLQNILKTYKSVCCTFCLGMKNDNRRISCIENRNSLLSPSQPINYIKGTEKSFSHSKSSMCKNFLASLIILKTWGWLVSVFKNYFLFFKIKNMQNVFDKRVFFVPICSSCFLKPDFQRTKKRCFSCFCHCFKKKKNKMFVMFSISVFGCSHLFTLHFSLGRKFFTLLGKIKKIKKWVLQKFNQKTQYYRTIFYFILFFYVILVSIFFWIFQDLSPYDFLDAFQSQNLHKFQDFP